MASESSDTSQDLDCISQSRGSSSSVQKLKYAARYLQDYSTLLQDPVQHSLEAARAQLPAPSSTYPLSASCSQGPECFNPAPSLLGTRETQVRWDASSQFTSATPRPSACSAWAGLPFQRCHGLVPHLKACLDITSMWTYATQHMNPIPHPNPDADQKLMHFISVFCLTNDAPQILQKPAHRA
jgi:hypothetical protein